MRSRPSYSYIKYMGKKITLIIIPFLLPLFARAQGEIGLAVKTLPKIIKTGKAADGAGAIITPLIQGEKTLNALREMQNLAAVKNAAGEKIPRGFNRNAPPLSAVAEAVPVDNKRAVWKLLDKNGNTVLFAKYMHPWAVQNLQKLHELKLAEKYTDVYIRIMKVSPLKFKDLPKNMQDQMQRHYIRLQAREIIRPRFEDDEFIPVLLVPEDLRGLKTLSDLREKQTFLPRKISAHDWQQFTDFLKDACLNEIFIDDLPANTYLGIDKKTGKTIFDLIDFEYGLDTRAGIASARVLEVLLEYNGVKEKAGAANYDFYFPRPPTAAEAAKRAKAEIEWYDGNNKYKCLTFGTAVYDGGRAVVKSAERPYCAGCTPRLKNSGRREAAAAYEYDKDGNFIFTPENPDYFFENIFLQK